MEQIDAFAVAVLLYEIPFKVVTYKRIAPRVLSAMPGMGVVIWRWGYSADTAVN